MALKIYKCKLGKRGGTEESEDLPYEHIEDFSVVTTPSSYLERTEGELLPQDAAINVPDVGQILIVSNTLDMKETDYFKLVDDVTNETFYYHFSAYSAMVNSDSVEGIYYQIQYILDLWMTHQLARYKKLVDDKGAGVEVNVVNCHSNRGGDNPGTGYSEINYIKYPQLRTLNTAIQTTSETIKDPLNFSVFEDPDYQRAIKEPLTYNVSITRGAKDEPSKDNQNKPTDGACDNHIVEVYNDASPDDEKIGFKYRLDTTVEGNSSYTINSDDTAHLAVVSTATHTKDVFLKKDGTDLTGEDYDAYFKGEDGQYTYVVINSTNLQNIKDGNYSAANVASGMLGGERSIYNNKLLVPESYYVGVPIRVAPIETIYTILTQYQGIAGHEDGSKEQGEDCQYYPSIGCHVEDGTFIQTMNMETLTYDTKYSTNAVDTGNHFYPLFNDYTGHDLATNYIKIKSVVPPSMLAGNNKYHQTGYKDKSGVRHISMAPIFICQSMFAPGDPNNNKNAWLANNYTRHNANVYHPFTNTCFICNFDKLAEEPIDTRAVSFFKMGERLVTNFTKGPAQILPENEPLLLNEGYLNCQLSIKKSGQGQLNYSMLNMTNIRELDQIEVQEVVTDLTYYKGDIPKTVVDAIGNEVDIICRDYELYACQEELLFQDDRTLPVIGTAGDQYLATNPQTMNTSRSLANINRRQDIMNSMINAGISVFSGQNLLKTSVLAGQSIANATINYNKTQKQIDSQVANIMNSPGVMSLPPYVGGMFDNGETQGFTSYLSPKSEKQVFSYFNAYGYIQNTILNSNKLGNRNLFNYVKLDTTFNPQQILDYTNDAVSNNLFKPYEYGKNFIDRLQSGVRVHKGGLHNYNDVNNYEVEQPNFYIPAITKIITTEQILPCTSLDGDINTTDLTIDSTDTQVDNNLYGAKIISFPRVDGTSHPAGGDYTVFLGQTINTDGSAFNQLDFSLDGVKNYDVLTRHSSLDDSTDGQHIEINNILHCHLNKLVYTYKGTTIPVILRYDTLDSSHKVRVTLNNSGVVGAEKQPTDSSYIPVGLNSENNVVDTTQQDGEPNTANGNNIRVIVACEDGDIECPATGDLHVENAGNHYQIHGHVTIPFSQIPDYGGDMNGFVFIDIITQ